MFARADMFRRIGDPTDKSFVDFDSFPGGHKRHRVSWPGGTLCLTTVSSNNGLNNAALSASAMHQATILRL